MPQTHTHTKSKNEVIVLLRFKWFLDPFWAKLGVQHGPEGVKILTFWNSNITTGFLPPPQKKHIPTQKLRKKYHFVEIYGVLGVFSTILGKIRGPWRLRRGQNFKLWNSETTTGFLTPKKMLMSDLRKNNHFIEIYGDLGVYLDHFGQNWGSVTSQKGSNF